ncbi:MAG TPA: hypothetical protein VF796_29100 [Humisphaera sp.]
MSTASSTPPPTEPTENRPATTSRWLAKAGVCAAVALTLALVALLGWRWFQVRFPTSVFVAYGDPTAADLDLQLFATDGTEVAQGRLTAERNYRFSVLVDEGTYVLRARMGDRSLPDQRVFIPGGRGVSMRIDLPPDMRSTAAATRPATLPADAAAPPP